MSTYYFLVCEKHKEKCDAASRTAGGFCHLVDSSETLPPFIITHRDCDLRVASEHEDEIYSEKYKEWNSKNVDEMYLLNRNPSHAL